MLYDLRGLGPAGLAKFVFYRPLPDDPDNDRGWWWDPEYRFDPTELAQGYTDMFRACGELLTAYSDEQLEQGIWFFISGADPALEDLIWHVDIPWSKRRSLILSIVDLYRDLFYTRPLHTSVHMFWDPLTYDFSVPTRFPHADPEARRVQQAMFDALVRILEMPPRHCQLAALHGLGHLRHAGTADAIAAFLQRCPDLSLEDRAYASACLAGDIR